MKRRVIKNIKRINVFLLITLNILSVAYGMATGVYLGLQVGQSNTHNTAANVQTGTGTTPATIFVTPTTTGMSTRLLFGYQFNNYGAFEIGYIHYSPAEYKLTIPNTLTGTPQMRENGVDLLGKLIWPAYGPFSVFGKVGATILRASPSGSLAPVGQRGHSQTSARPTFGVGASYDITQNWQTDISVLQVMGGGGIKNINFVGFELTYHWVDYFCGQFLC